ncbi:MAG TPA: TetR/AcrR family transcriptional regulator [Bacteroidales bacterium]|nr:TetR/AcrR family transcriptional regulator [Bacteroidales bacterium]
MNEELKQIIEKVQALYFKYGIKSVTMDDVARELGMSKKTLYQHVSDKNDLVQKVVNYVMERDHDEFDEIFENHKNAIEELIEMTLYINKVMKNHNPSTIYDLKKYYPNLYKVMMEKRRDKMFQHTINNLKKGKEQGIYRTEIKEDIIAKYTTILTFQTFENDTLDMNEFTSPDFFNEVFSYHIRGIANAKGLEILEHNLNKITENK